MGFLRSLPAAALGLSCGILSVQTAWGAPTPTQVEAVFLFNFSQFVEWPPNSFRNDHAPLVIGVLGADPFGATLDEVVRDEIVKGHALVVQRFRRVEDVADCQILFVSRSEHDRLQQILRGLQGRSILTVSDLDEFARAGGMIRFVMMENRVRLRINVEAAQAAGLTISSKLLQSARIVGEGHG